MFLRGKKPEHEVGEIVVRVVLGLRPERGFRARRRLPIAEDKLGQAQKIVRMRSARIQRYRAVEFADRILHEVPVAVRPPEEHVQRAAVAGDLQHLLEDLRGAGFVFRLPGLQQAFRKRVKVVHRGLCLGDLAEWLDRLAVLALLVQSAGQNHLGAKIARIARQSLPRKLDGLVQIAGLDFSECHGGIRAGSIFILQRNAVEFHRL